MGRGLRLVDEHGVLALHEDVSARAHLFVVVAVVHQVVGVGRQHAQHAGGVPHQVHTVEAHHTVALVDLAGQHLAVVQRLQLQDVHVPLALRRHGDDRQHERLVPLVLDEVQNELAHRPIDEERRGNTHGSLISEGDERLALVEVGSVEGPELTGRDRETDVEKADSTDVGRFLQMRLSEDSYVVDQLVQLRIGDAHLGELI